MFADDNNLETKLHFRHGVMVTATCLCDNVKEDQPLHLSD